MLSHRHKTAFTLLEVIFAIVILGIVASIGTSIITQVYESYIMQKSIHNASFKTELAVQQIANRLSYRIDKSMLARKPNSKTNTIGTDIYPLQSLPIDKVDKFTALEWIGYDNDGFSATNPPGWSGFVDLNRSDFTKIVSIGSSLKKEKKVLSNLFDGNTSAAIIFAGTTEYRIKTNGTVLYYQAACMYQTDGCIFRVVLDDNATLTFGNSTIRAKGEMKYTEFYKLAASAYAVVPENKHDIDGVTVWDLYLYYNYQPWDGENYIDNGNKSLLARNVSVFRFKKETNAIRVKICITQVIGDGAHTSICKEKAAIR